LLSKDSCVSMRRPVTYEGADPVTSHPQLITSSTRLI